MKLLSLNCRGLGSSTAIGAVRRLVRRTAPDVLFLCDTKLTETQLIGKRSLIGFPNGVAGSYTGQSGGVALLWSRDVNVQLLSYSGRHIDFLVLNEEGLVIWRGTGIYGWPAASAKYKTWELLHFLAAQSSSPWVVFGDWNAMLYPNEKRGGGSFDISLARDFHTCTSLIGLNDLGYTGSPFTWTNKRRDSECIWERLDRFMATENWCNIHPRSRVSHILGGGSDHLAILLDTSPPPPASRKWKRGLQFERLWVKDPNFAEIVKESWEGTSHLSHLGDRFKACNAMFTSWSKKKNGNLAERTKTLRHKVEMGWAHGHSNLPALEAELCEVEDKHEAYWAQRAHHNYLLDGDKNTSFFHLRAKHRSARVVIGALEDSTGALCSDFASLNKLIFDYFQAIYTTNGSSHDWGSLPELHGKINARDISLLEQPYTRLEVEMALKEFYPSKAPGPDGMSALFLQQYWHVVGDEVSQMVLRTLNDGHFEEGLNDTLIRLIPKIKHPKTVADYRPISLCNVRYKLVSKVLSNRIRPILDKMIESTQSAFVKGRLITDNFLIAYELLHFFKGKRSGKQYAALKLDMSKAFDRVEWPFLEAVLTELGLPEKWIRVAMLCVTTVSFKVLLNEGYTDSIIPTRGIRQGDPLSPCLFLFCMTGLSILIQRGLHLRAIHGVKVCRHAPIISHLFFADDTMLFLRATVAEALAVKEILESFERWTGQKINFAKSELFFSMGTTSERQHQIISILGVSHTLQPGKYLGLPALVGRSKEAAFGILREKIFKRSISYKINGLSQAGRAIIIKSVFQAIPSYIMGVFKLPIHLCDELNGMMSRFFWHGDLQKTCIYWLPWKSLCLTKPDGGLGFRDLSSFNSALLAKQVWRMLHNPSSLVSQVLKARYFPRGTILDAGLGYNPSFTWRSILYGRDTFRKHCAWNIGDGLATKVWGDRWLPGGSSLLRTFHSSCPDDAKVHDLIDMETRDWDSAKLSLWFPADIAEQIRLIPISPGESDKAWWPSTVNGGYTVNSGYKELIRSSATSSSSVRKDTWNKLWRLPAHPRVLMLMWRMMWCILPTKWRLHNKKVNTDLICPLCATDIETLKHVLFECSNAREIWDGLGLSNLLVTMGHDVQGWLFELISTRPTEEFLTFCYAIEAIWDARNRITHHHSPFDSQRVLQRVCNSIQHLNSARAGIHQVKNQPSSLVGSSWLKPAAGFVKLNFDASCHPMQQGAGIGLILRHADGSFMGARTIFRAVTWPIELLEAWAGLMGVEWASGLGISKLHIEGDSKMILDQMAGKMESFTYTTKIISQLHSILPSFDQITFTWAPRCQNETADRLARFALSARDNTSWDSDPPPWLIDTLCIDSSSS